MDSPPNTESNGKKEPSVEQPSETPLILFCKIHKDEKGEPRPYSVLGERTIHRKDENGVWHDEIEPIYECMACVFPEAFEKVK